MRWLLVTMAAVLLSSAARAAGQDTPRSPVTEVLSPAETKVLEQIRQLKGQQWRVFGACRYSWGSWRMGDNDVRLTDVQCGAEWAVKGTIAVHCASLRVNRKLADGAWEAWRLPLGGDESTSSGGEDRMVAALCANIAPSARPAPAAAAPAPAAAAPAPAAAPTPEAAPAPRP